MRDYIEGAGIKEEEILDTNHNYHQVIEFFPPIFDIMYLHIYNVSVCRYAWY